MMQMETPSKRLQCPIEAIRLLLCLFSSSIVTTGELGESSNGVDGKIAKVRTQRH
jgi:hypothetical protein